MMTEIYLKAYEVQAWIGIPNDNSGLVFDILGELSFTKFPGNSPEDYKKAVSNTIHDPSYQTTRLALSLFCNRSYWRRCWIIQELVKNIQCHVRCGRRIGYAFDLYRLLDNVINIQNKRMSNASWNSQKSDISHSIIDPSFGFSRLRLKMIFEFCWDYHFKQPEQRQDILGMVTMLQKQDCKIPRDRFYSLLGICRPYDRETLQVDYECTDAKANIDFALHVIRGGQTLDILNCCNSRKARSSEQPSWVPTWNVDPGTEKFLPWNCRGWIAGGNARVHLTPTNERILDVAAYILGEVQLPFLVARSDGHSLPVVSLNPLDILKLELLSTFTRQFKHFVLTSLPEFDGDNHRFQNVEKTRLIAIEILRVFHRSFQEVDDFTELSATGLSHFLAKLFPESGEVSELGWPEVIFELKKPPIVDLLYWLPDNVMIFKTTRPTALQTDQQKYLYGVSDASFGEGDIVAVIEGCNCPIILRPAEKENHYRVVSNAYVEGVMHGEILNILPRQTIQLE
jgi:hypothetical protein